MCIDKLYVCGVCPRAFGEEDPCEFAFDSYNYDVKSALDCLDAK